MVGRELVSTLGYPIHKSLKKKYMFYTSNECFSQIISRQLTIFCTIFTLWWLESIEIIPIMEFKEGPGSQGTDQCLVVQPKSLDSRQDSLL